MDASKGERIVYQSDDGDVKLEVRLEGERRVNRALDHYNLDMIILVGYRVKSIDRETASLWR